MRTVVRAVGLAAALGVASLSFAGGAQAKT
jgi:hypothetical protein